MQNSQKTIINMLVRSVKLFLKVVPLCDQEEDRGSPESVKPRTRSNDFSSCSPKID